MVAIAGKGYVIMASDTRFTDGGYGILSRNMGRVFRIGGTSPTQEDATMLLTLGYYVAGANEFKDALDRDIQIYEYSHGKKMSLAACAQRISKLLYSRRFLPYLTNVTLGGIDENEDGAVYSYDVVGSFERELKSCTGAASALLMPFLDSQVNFKNQYIPGSGEGLDLKPKEEAPLPEEKAEKIVKDAFNAVAERHIEVGEGLTMVKLARGVITEESTTLRRD
jgi:20S proteasome subunit beta 6